jgi:hypothetical protein
VALEDDQGVGKKKGEFVEAGGGEEVDVEESGTHQTDIYHLQYFYGLMIWF